MIGLQPVALFTTAVQHVVVFAPMPGAGEDDALFSRGEGAQRIDRPQAVDQGPARPHAAPDYEKRGHSSQPWPLRHRRPQPVEHPVEHGR